MNLHSYVFYIGERERGGGVTTFVCLCTCPLDGMKEKSAKVA